MDLSRALAITASAMEAQSARLRHVSENVANADTPGYRRKTVPFEAGDDGTLHTGRVTLDQTPLPQIYDPGNPMADASGHYLGSNVDPILEIADAREASRSYEANLKMFEQTRQMSAGLLELLRR